MSDPTTPDDTPQIPEEKTVAEADTTDAPADTSADAKEEPPESQDAVPEQETPEKREKRKNLLITVGVAAIIIIAAACAFVFLTPQVATTGDQVSVYYTGAFDNGTVFDSNMNGTPLEFTLGNKTVIAGFENAVIGMSKNQVKTVTVPYADAYGAYDPGLVQTLNRTGPLANVSFIVGKTYTVHDKVSNTYSRIKILNVTPTTITWDANSPLAGQNLTFMITLANLTKMQQ
ncbi:MAG: FKBP-type peptidyl-prolyl cis-trans isomerase [Methanoregula sp.]|jgi:peptidylprolyl isomerase|uniref:FKBP-type peptidyl-prolyl cis-trans isomerase n=1 Tax=Methanoregula sp. TaxID=2052170 RepID=UPI003C768066